MCGAMFSRISTSCLAIASSSGQQTNLPAAVGDLATGLADYTREQSVQIQCFVFAQEGGQGAWGTGI